MPLTAAIQEAYASAPAGVVIYHTLELRHSSFTQPIYVVRDYVDLSARIEPTSTVNGGSYVTFIGIAFNLTKPEISSTGIPQITIEIDNVDSSIVNAIEAAVSTTELVKVIYREYIATPTDLTGLSIPQNNPPTMMTMVTVSATPFRISATATFVNLANRRFPTLEYNANTFPSLL